MKKYSTLLFFALTLQIAWGQFRAGVVVGLNSTTLGEFNEPEFDTRFRPKQQFMAGVDLEWVFRQKLKHIYLSVGSGVYYLKNGYEDGTYYTALFSNEQYPVISNYETKYLQVPFSVRLNFQPQPLEEDFSFFIGAGISNHFLVDASLYEITVGEETFGGGVSVFEDSRNIKDYGSKSYLFSNIEFGMVLNRTKVTFRYKKSLQDMYFAGLDGNWNVPDEFSIYKGVYNRSGKLTERHLEISLSYFIFR